MPERPRDPSWLSRLLCRIRMHDWSDGPGYPCVKCGAPDELFTAPVEPGCYRIEEVGDGE